MGILEPLPHSISLSMSNTETSNTETTKHIIDLLLIVFVHGFKGTDETFSEFPQRLQHILTETTNDVSVECIVFPAYEVRGVAMIHGEEGE